MAKANQSATTIHSTTLSSRMLSVHRSNPSDQNAAIVYLSHTGCLALSRWNTLSSRMLCLWITHRHSVQADSLNLCHHILPQGIGRDWIVYSGEFISIISVIGQYTQIVIGSLSECTRFGTLYIHRHHRWAPGYTQHPALTTYATR